MFVWYLKFGNLQREASESETAEERVFYNSAEVLPNPQPIYNITLISTLPAAVYGYLTSFLNINCSSRNLTTIVLLYTLIERLNELIG